MRSAQKDQEKNKPDGQPSERGLYPIPVLGMSAILGLLLIAPLFILKLEAPDGWLTQSLLYSHLFWLGAIYGAVLAFCISGPLYVLWRSGSLDAELKKALRNYVIIVGLIAVITAGFDWGKRPANYEASPLFTNFVERAHHLEQYQTIRDRSPRALCRALANPPDFTGYSDVWDPAVMDGFCRASVGVDYSGFVAFKNSDEGRRLRRHNEERMERQRSAARRSAMSRYATTATIAILTFLILIQVVSARLHISYYSSVERVGLMTNFHRKQMVIGVCLALIWFAMYLNADRNLSFIFTNESSATYILMCSAVAVALVFFTTNYMMLSDGYRHYRAYGLVVTTPIGLLLLANNLVGTDGIFRTLDELVGLGAQNHTLLFHALLLGLIHLYFQAPARTDWFPPNDDDSVDDDDPDQLTLGL